MLLLTSVFCYIFNISCIDKNGGEDIQAIREKGNALFTKNLNCASEGIDFLSLNSTTRLQEHKEIIEETDGNIYKRNKRDFGDLVNSNSFINLDDVILQKENQRECSKECVKVMFKEIKSNSEYEVEVDGENGIDNEECGLLGNTPCKTIKMATERCQSEGNFVIHTAKSCNKFDSEPIIIDGRDITLFNAFNSIIFITTALDETKVESGDALFCVKNKGRFCLCLVEICIDTKRESGRNQGLIVVDGKCSQIEMDGLNISNIEEGNELNCVLIKCIFGEMIISFVNISSFLSSNALTFAEASPKIEFSHIMLDTITSKSKTQSVVTVMGGCQSAKFDGCTFTNCWSTEHRLGGAIYLEIMNCEDSCSFSSCIISNCSCGSSNTNTVKMNKRKINESKGGAMLIQVANDAAESLDLKIDGLSISDRAAEKGEYI